MKIIKQIAAVILPLALLIPSIVNAAVSYPALDIQLFSGDAGAYLTDTGSGGFDFDIDATAFAIVYDDEGTSTDIANQAFTLHGTFDGSSAFFGTFSVAGGLLSGTFDDLTIQELSSGTFDFAANLLYDTDSSLNTDSGIGRLEGVGSTINLSAKLGLVAVPVPAAVWLFGAGLIGLVGVARRKA